MRYIIQMQSTALPDPIHDIHHSDPDYPGFENCGLTYPEWLAASGDGGLAETFIELGSEPGSRPNLPAAMR